MRKTSSILVLEEQNNVNEHETYIGQILKECDVEIIVFWETILSCRTGPLSLFEGIGNYFFILMYKPHVHQLNHSLYLNKNYRHFD